MLSPHFGIAFCSCNSADYSSCGLKASGCSCHHITIRWTIVFPSVCANFHAGTIFYSINGATLNQLSKLIRGGKTVELLIDTRTAKEGGNSTVIRSSPQAYNAHRLNKKTDRLLYKGRPGRLVGVVSSSLTTTCKGDLLIVF